MNKVRPDVKKIAVLICWAIFIIFAIVRIVSQQGKIRDYSTQYSELTRSVEELDERATELATQAELYLSDDYIEEIARTKLGYVRSDEIVFKRAD